MMNDLNYERIAPIDRVDGVALMLSSLLCGICTFMQLEASPIDY